jgi:hypothetical protein
VISFYGKSNLDIFKLVASKLFLSKIMSGFYLTDEELKADPDDLFSLLGKLGEG